jgi:uncharacterized protein (PEP-CTERM system associated)
MAITRMISRDSSCTSESARAQLTAWQSSIPRVLRRYGAIGSAGALLAVVPPQAAAQYAGPTTPPQVGAQGAAPASAAQIGNQSPLPGPTPQGAAETAPYTPWVSLQETATNNVNLSGSSTRQSDFVTEITPSLRLNERGPRSAIGGVISVPIVLYARTGAENNKVWPAVNVLGTLQPIDHFFIEGSAVMSQEFFNPFGAQPTDLANATQNRYRSSQYDISPYVKGVTQQGIDYELRDNNLWTRLSGAPDNTSNSYTQEVIGTLSNTQARVGWKADYDYTNVQFTDGNSIRTQLGRVAPVWNVDPQWQVNASVGYEANDYTFTSSSNAIYGLGVQWRPTERTNMVGNWEHRFFGSSYLFSFANRTPLSTWSVQAYRNITTYPQQLATLGAGVDVNSLLNSLFLARIPDPAERQRVIDQFISDRGLPSVLGSPVALYSQQILLQRSVSASVGLLGARNSLLFTVFNLDSEAITAQGEVLPPELSGANNNRQTGASLAWTYNITPSLLLTTFLYAEQTAAKSPLTGNTRQWSANLQISKPIAPRTDVFAGARYQAATSDVQANYTEVAGFVGLRHFFR